MEPLLTVKEVSEILKCGVATVYELLSRGDLVGCRCPGWRVSRPDLEDYLQRSRQEPPAKKAKRAPAHRLKHVRL